MRTEILMPQMGESIVEGTITKWLKKVGDQVEKDEPLFEISTDKVDAEIPAPVAGVLSEISFVEGETVQVNAVVAVLADSASAKVTIAAPRRGPGAHTSSTSFMVVVPRKEEPSGGDLNIVMPQMGESITEGTITKWLKQVGDQVEKDEPLFEISTDKVDAEIPSPMAGVLTAIKFAEGETVPVNAVIAAIGPKAPVHNKALEKETPSTRPESSAVFEQTPHPADSDRPLRCSLLARRVAQQNQIEISDVPSTGLGGRTTKRDVLRSIEQGEAKPQPKVPNINDKVVPLSRMRSIIAQRMVGSVQISPHVHTIYKIDMTRVVQARERAKAAFEQREGVKLTFMPFIAAATVTALSKHPIINASLSENAIHYHASINLGIAVALDWGLIVPVVRGAESLSFENLARAMSNLVARARSKKLNPDEASGSTFTLTNSGIFGDEFTTPIINQPDSAILGISGLKKEPAIFTDADGTDSIAIRSMQHFTLGFDHRLIDGADACKFMVELKGILENWIV